MKVAVGNFPRVTRRREEIFAALALIQSSGADICDRELPCVNLPGETAVGAGGRKFEHGRAFLQVGVSGDVRRRVVCGGASSRGVAVDE